MTAHELTADLLVVGAGGAGMYAAIAAAREGANVLLVDKNMVGRGGATIMAQMTVAGALAESEPDTWEEHLDDTLRAGRGLCDVALARTLCREAPERLREMDAWGVGWARHGSRDGHGKRGHILQALAPGHGRQRCVYVDFLNTGPAVAATLRRRVSHDERIRRVSNVAVTDILTGDCGVEGAVGVSLTDGADVSVTARSVVIATGGLTKLYARSSASNHMSGEGYALALRAGARLMDMEFVQFFPIGHLAPRLVGMDPIMWDPFRYKLGGRLLNGEMQEFIDRYGGEDHGRYTATRDLATYAICKEVEAGRGSPHNGAYLSFAHIAESELRAAFGPVIDRLLNNGIDLRESPVEVAPIAHYHMGGIEVDERMASRICGLYAAGEAVGGASGANRLSGNAITEALVFGEIAGREAAVYAAASSGKPLTPAAVRRGQRPDARPHTGGQPSAVTALAQLRALMWRDVGPFRTRSGLESALARIRELREDHRDSPSINGVATYVNTLMDAYELRDALTVAESVTASALAREESRGAHQREDFPDTDPDFELHMYAHTSGGQLDLVRGAALRP